MKAIATKIRRGEGLLWRTLRSTARKLLSVHVPVVPLTKPIIGMLYGLHLAVREGLAWLARFFWYEPLFRSQCESVGPGFRMEQLPYITGHGRITVGCGVRLSGKSSFGFSNRLHARPSLSIGDHSFIGHDCSFGIGDSIQIGRHCLLAGGVTIRDLDGHPIDAALRREHHPTPKDGIRAVVIGNDVWVGAGATILKGVSIGDRSIVGAHAVVTSDVAPDTVVAGNPARVIKTLNARAAA